MPTLARRLPIYLLLDCSESMVGEPFTAVRDGLATLMADLRSDPMALETAHLSVITFASTARQLMPLTEAFAVTPPTLPMGSGTALGAALALLTRCLDTDVVRGSAERKGDWKPICFLLTDGRPTDAWQAAADTFRRDVLGRRANLIAVAVGRDADPAALRRATDVVLRMPTPVAGVFRTFFQWVSSSVDLASRQIGTAGEAGVALPPLPAGVQLARPADDGPPPAADAHVFLRGRCCRSGQFHLRRYTRSESGAYLADGAFPVDTFEEPPAGEPGVTIAASDLVGAAACPSCGASTWARCRQGHVHCCPDYAGSVQLTCPWCHVTETYGDNGTFDVAHGRG